jgi:predicted nucleotidyltransferase
MEIAIIRRLAAELVEAGIPVRQLRVFGSRARGHSHAQSDLDMAFECLELARRFLADTLALLPEGTQGTS